MTLSSTSTAHLLASQTGEEMGMCQASAGATVKHQPESVSRINRNSVKDQVTPERQASPETRHTSVPPAGIEPATHGLGNRCSIDWSHTQLVRSPSTRLPPPCASPWGE